MVQEEANALNFSATSEAEYDVDDGADLGVDEVIDLNAFDGAAYILLMPMLICR